VPLRVDAAGFELELLRDREAARLGLGLARVVPLLLRFGLVDVDLFVAISVIPSFEELASPRQGYPTCRAVSLSRLG
jgi:hypothetical protein